MTSETRSYHSPARERGGLTRPHKLQDVNVKNCWALLTQRVAITATTSRFKGDGVERWPAVANNASRCGFTLIELLISILIMVILAVNVAPRFQQSLVRRRLQAGCRRIQADLQAASRAARHRNASSQMIFVPNADRYYVPELPGLRTAQSVYRVDLNAAPYHVDLVQASFSAADDPVVQFAETGHPDSGGTIVMRAGSFQQSVTLQAGSARAELGAQVRWK